MEFARIRVLFKKEVKSLFTNWNILSICLVPVLFSFIYTNVFNGVEISEGISKYEILYICLDINIITIAGFMIAILIAEEKEKNTLRTLMLSGVSQLDFLTGKVIITFLITEILNVLIFFIIGIDSIYLGEFILITSLLLIIMIEIGATVGISVKNQMAAGTVGTPIFIIFLIVPIFSSFSKSVEYVAGILPNYNMDIIFRKMFSGGTIGIADAKNIVVIIVWIIASGIIFMQTYNRIGLDK
jgi:ABC-2 type transport system permease protein